jgi:hypothetical protein
MANGKVNVPATKNSAERTKKEDKNLPMVPSQKTINTWSKEGITIFEAYFAGEKLENEANQIFAKAEMRKGEASARMVTDMVHIFKAEPLALDMAEKAFIGGKAVMPKVHEYFKVCFGYAKILKDSEGNIVTEETDLWKKRFHAPKNASPETTQQYTEKRNNFSTFMKTNMQKAVALGALKEIDEITFDEASKAISVTGKGAEKVFGSNTAILNQRDGKDEPAAKGKMVASLEALRKQAVEKRKPSTGAGGKGKEEGSAAEATVKTQAVTEVDNQKAAQQAINAAIFYINKLNRKADPDTRKVMKNLSDIISPFIDKLISSGTEEHNKVTLAKAAKDAELKAEKANVAGTEAKPQATTQAAKNNRLVKRTNRR